MVLPVTATAEEKLTVLFLGDSLTAGYGIEQEKAFPALIKSIALKEGKDIEVVNAGMSGDTSAGALRRLPWYLKNRVDICMVALGANDGLRGLPVPAMKENLLEIIDKLKAANPDMKIILAGIKIPMNFGEPYRLAFEAVFSEVSKEKNTIFIPFLLEGVAGDPNLNLPDRLHPSEAGHAVMAKAVWPVVKDLL